MHRMVLTGTTLKFTSMYARMVSGTMLPVQHGRAPVKRRGRLMPTKKGCVWAMLKHYLQKTEGEPCTSSGKPRKSTVVISATGQTMAAYRGTGSDRGSHRYKIIPKFY